MNNGIYMFFNSVLLSLDSLADRTGTEWKANLTLIQSSVYCFSRILAYEKILAYSMRLQSLCWQFNSNTVEWLLIVLVVF